MKVLGIETSCDETAVCIIEADGTFGGDFRYRVLGDALYSQVATHAPWGGVFPNLAKREHARTLVPLLNAAPAPAGGRPAAPGGATSGMDDLPAILAREPELFEMLEEFLKSHGKPAIDAIAVTAGPGLEPALWVGVNFAKALAIVWNLPIVATNHLEGHIAIAAMRPAPENSSLQEYRELFSVSSELAFPALALLISGGHTELDLITAWPHFELVGQTRDDAVGEAFDKTARLLGIPYPGGAALSALASQARKNTENSSLYKLPRPMIHEDNFDFSFSGLKTAVRRAVEGREITQELKLGIALEFENAATDVLVSKTKRAAEEYGAQALLVGGGVSANEFIKQRLRESLDIPVFAPPSSLSTDNAQMIALAGYFHALKKEFVDPATLRANGNWRLDQDNRAP
jgi:N6-L-threonylcarbamoyladenine synthase